MNDISFSSLTESTDGLQTTAHLTWLRSEIAGTLAAKT